MNQDGPDPARHAPLLDTAWDAGEARSAVQEIIDDAEAHLRPHGLWPAHPQDDNLPDDAAGLYMGGAGVVWALDHLRRHGFRVGLDLPALLPRIRDARRAEARRFGQYAALPSLLMGDVGLLLLEMRLAGSDGTAERLGSRVAEACYLPVRELMWGLPGAMLACLDAHALTGDARWRGLFRSGAARLLGDLRDSQWGPIWVAGPVWQGAALAGSGARPCRQPRPAAAWVGLARCRAASGRGGVHALRAASHGASSAAGHDVAGRRRTGRSCPPCAALPRRAGHGDDARGRAGAPAGGRAVAAGSRRADVAGRAACEGQQPVPRHGRERLRLPAALAPYGRGRVARTRGRSR